MSLRVWSRECRTNSWTKLLSTATLPLSTQNRGVDSWIASLQATRANPSLSQESERARTTPGTCGPTSATSSTHSNQNSSSSKTSPDTCPRDSKPSTMTFKQWVSQLRRPSSRPRRSDSPTGETASSSLLPTPTAQSYGSNHGGAAGRTGPVRYSLQTMAKKGLLPTPTGAGRATAVGGPLNPQFVEWMMGFPSNWTSLGPISEETQNQDLQQEMPEPTLSDQRDKTMAYRVDRIRALGNAVAPAQALAAFNYLHEPSSK